MTKKNNITPVSVRMSSELKEALEFVCEYQSRSISQQIEFFIKQGLKELALQDGLYLSKFKDLSLDLGIQELTD